MTITAPEARVFEGVQIRELETTESLTKLSGKAVPYRAQADIGWYMETFDPGSLAKSIRESAAALPLLLFHNAESFPIGAASEWDDTDEALRGVWNLDDDPVAQRAAKLAHDGTLSFMSIRFVPVRSKWTYAKDFQPDLGPAYKDSVVRQEARLVETSLVSTPAYAGATVEWVRTAGAPERKVRRKLDAWERWLEGARTGRP